MKSKQIEFPDCWEEVTPHEWVYLLKLRSKLIRLRGVTIDDVKRMWCAFVVKRRGIRSLNRKDAMVLIYRLAQTLDWQWVVENDSISLNYDSTVNLLPEWYGLIGPASHGADLTFGEFRYAVIMMNEYTTTQDIMYLNSLCFLRMLFNLLYRILRKSLNMSVGVYMPGSLPSANSCLQVLSFLTVVRYVLHLCSDLPEMIIHRNSL